MATFRGLTNFYLSKATYMSVFVYAWKRLTETFFVLAKKIRLLLNNGSRVSEF